MICHVLFIYNPQVFLEGLTSGLFLQPHHGQRIWGLGKNQIYVVYSLQVFLVHELSPIDSGWLYCVPLACLLLSCLHLDDQKHFHPPLRRMIHIKPDTGFACRASSPCSAG